MACKVAAASHKVSKSKSRIAGEASPCFVEPRLLSVAFCSWSQFSCPQCSRWLPVFHSWSSTICTVRLFSTCKIAFSLAILYRTVYSLQCAGFALFAAFIYVYCVHDWERAWHHQIYLQILCARNADPGRLHSFMLNHRLLANFCRVVAAHVYWSRLLVYESTKLSQKVSF